MNNITYIFDIDKTICKQKKEDSSDYFIENLIPNKEMIDIINKLYSKGNIVIILTGRGSMTGLDWKDETEYQLRVWGVSHNELRFVHKPLNYVYIDDKACDPETFIKRMKYVL